MKKIKKRSVLTVKSSFKEIKVIPEKNLFENGIAKIFSKEPSHLGYKEDIDNLINDIGLKEEDFLYLTILSLAKIVRNKNDQRIISSYLYSMPNFIKLVKGNNNVKTEQEIMKVLLSLSRSITYEKVEKNHIVMKLGDIGTSAYIILKGTADVLLKCFKIMSITKNDYLFYLANLIRYGEYGLLNDVINENFNTLPLEIGDDNIIPQIESDSKDIYRKNTMQSDDMIQLKHYSKDTNPFIKKSNDSFGTKKYSKNNQNNICFKINEKNIDINAYKKSFKISEEKLLEMFNMKKINNKHLDCPYLEYINRIRLIPNDYKLYINEKYVPKKESKENEEEKEEEEEEEKNDEKKKIKKDNKKDKEEKEKENDDDNTLYYLKIYSYMKVNSMGKGDLFGELALSQDDCLRTATVITSKDCDIAVLNKKIFNNCLKKGTSVIIKKLLSFFVNLPIFTGISEYIFYNKYYTYLSKKIMTRGNILVNQGEPVKGIILLNSGSYGISSRISLYSLTNLIFHYININQKIKKDYNENHKLLKNITKIINKTKVLINENPKFKKFYMKEINIRVSELLSPDVIGYNEYSNENGLYAFTIETRASENIFYILDDKFYSEILRKNSMIMKNEQIFTERKLDVIIHRLMILRNCLVNFFFENRMEKINSIITKELDNINNSKIKEKSQLKNKNTEYNLQQQSIIIKKKENYKRNFKYSEEKEKYINSYGNYSASRNKKNKISFWCFNFDSNSKNKNFNYFKRKQNNINLISLQKSPKNIHKKEKRDKMTLTSKNSGKNIKDNNSIFYRTFHSYQRPQEEIQKNFYFDVKNEIQMSIPRLKSSYYSYKHFETTKIILNNLILEDLNKKNKKNIILKNKKIATSFRHINNKKINFRLNRPFLWRSQSVSTLRNSDINSSANKAIKIALNIKRVYSPLEKRAISCMRNINKNNILVKKNILNNKKLIFRRKL